jgi:hypothetical protein
MLLWNFHWKRMSLKRAKYIGFIPLNKYYER